MALLVTPAGLFNVAPEGVSPDLRLEVTELSPWPWRAECLAW